MAFHYIYQGDNLEIMRNVIKSEFADLIYIDPPFYTNKVQHRNNKESYQDCFPCQQAYHDFIMIRIKEAYRILKSNGSFFLHIDYRESHYLKCLIDEVFGRGNFINEIIWAYDFGGRSRTRWATKHDSIFWYVKNLTDYTFNYEAIERIPYMAPGFVGPEKAKAGKALTDVWWHTIVGTNSKEKTGYPTQKPLGIINRIIQVHSNPNDICFDFFAGSGTLVESAALHNRSSISIDKNPQAIAHIKSRLGIYPNVEVLNL